MNKSRRSFIKNSSFVVAGAGLLPHNFSFTEDKRQKLAIQLFSVDKEMHSDAATALKTLKKIGYKYVEHGDYIARKFYGFSPKDFRNLIQDNGLILLSGHTVLTTQHWDKSKQDFTKEWYNVIEDAATAQQQYLITPWLDGSLWNNETKLKHFMDVFNKCGVLCEKSGLRFGYHNHDFEFTHTLNGLQLYDIILQHTDPALVHQQLDIGNSYRHNSSINHLFNQYPNRFQLMHVKDIATTNERHRQYKSVSVGEGVVDIKSIIDDARKNGGTYNFILEQNDYASKSPLECAEKNYHAFDKLRTGNKFSL